MKSTPIFARISIFILTGFSLACSPRLESKSSIHEIAQNGIIGGELVAAGDPIISSVVGIYNRAEKSICTGSLLLNNTVLTAAHCIATKPTEMFVVFAPDMNELLKSKDDARIHKLVRRVSSAKAYPSYDAFADKPDVTANDIGLLHFTGSVPDGYTAATFTYKANIREGKSVVLAGYGISQVEHIEVDPKTIPNIEQAVANQDIYCSSDRTQCERLVNSGDGNLRSVETKIMSLYEKEVLVGSTTQGSCHGDSGGPAYIFENGRYYLWGVTNRGLASCVEGSTYTNALEYMDWINRVSIQLK